MKCFIRTFRSIAYCLGQTKIKLCVLSSKAQVAGSNLRKHYKLPGSLIYESEDLDTAAYRVLNEATGLKRVALKQFRSFGSPAVPRIKRMCNGWKMLPK